MGSDVDSDRENLFQILTARITAIKGEVLEFTRALKKELALNFLALATTMENLGAR